MALEQHEGEKAMRETRIFIFFIISHMFYIDITSLISSKHITKTLNPMWFNGVNEANMKNLQEAQNFL